jgi:hypothetical protein
MTLHELIQTQLHQSPKTWLITGLAGFIGSNLLKTLLKLDQREAVVNDLKSIFPIGSVDGRV